MSEQKRKKFLLKLMSVQMGISYSYKAKRKGGNAKILAVNKWSGLLILSIGIYLVHKASFNLFLDGVAQILWCQEIPHVKTSLYNQLLLHRSKFSFSEKYSVSLMVNSVVLKSDRGLCYWTCPW